MQPVTKCGGTNRQGQPCGNVAGKGTDHYGSGNCKNHGGASPNGKKHAATLSARQQLERLITEPLTPAQYVDPIGALLSAVTEASMVVAYLRQQIMENERYASDGEPAWTHMLTMTTPDGTTREIGEEARAMVTLYGEWHDRLVRAAKACAAAKIDERVVRLHEAQGARLDAAFRLFLVAMAEQFPFFTAEVQSTARQVFAAKFRELTPRLEG